jgi:uncharacterized SAM-binding protein YcdF (DUF218 family)
MIRDNGIVMAETPPVAGGEEPAKTGPRQGIAGRLIFKLNRWIASGFILLVVGVVIGFAWFLGRVPTVEPTSLERADGIVVLTGGASRVSDAIELLASGHGKRLLISGVHPAASPRDIARHTPQFERIFACCVDLDRSAVNTLGNATEARRWAQSHGFRSLIIVTSAYHMPRAMVELGHQLPEVRLIPFPVVTEKMRDEQWWSTPATARLLISEYAKYLLALMRIRVGVETTALVASEISANVPDPVALQPR